MCTGMSILFIFIVLLCVPKSHDMSGHCIQLLGPQKLAGRLGRLIQNKPQDLKSGFLSKILQMS